MLNLGGTIDLDYRRGSATQGAMRRFLPAGLEVVDLEPVQGNDLVWRHLRALRAELINPARANERFLVTVGTDVLEEVLYFVSLVRRRGTPIAVVGSFAPPAAAGNGVRSSLSAAVEWLERPDAEGVAACIDGDVIVGSIGEKVFVDQWRFRLSEATDDRLPDWKLDASSSLVATPPRVPLVTMCVDCARWIRDAALRRSFDGVVISGYGSGDVPAALMPTLVGLVAKGIPVVLASRSRPGIVEDAFAGIPGASHDLLHAGVLGAGRLPDVLSRIRLLTALAARPRVRPSQVFQSESVQERN